MASAPARPYGFRPVNMLGGQVHTGSHRLMRINTAYATSIFMGDVVCLDALGFITRAANATDVTTSVGDMPIGVFMGCEFETTQGLLHKNWWTGGTVTITGKPIWGYVVDDPTMLFEVQSSGSVPLAALGTNANMVLTAGDTATGRSKMAISVGGLFTALSPIRIVDYVDRPGSVAGDAFTDVVVRFNNHRHIHPVAF